ncbi:3'-5' ssDNA/RNA exonuclease TatD-like [Ruditapes philippinarum]|uniref:3'-5' ssDNA/RNA exonuclease TatD-like n=1 Tax=Ruditapes philippinarum TaxID=129788 RepID=UPI00295A64D8|nr:3'-5' ssDNA/RNA exonuclease TatD-like [Ruditapes philippinarum]
MEQFHYSEEPSEPTKAPADVPKGFDSHFHLDRLQGVMRMRGASLAEINQATGDPYHRVNLVGAVANFCDPATYPSEDLVRKLYQRVSVTIGLHHKDIGEVTDDTLKRMESLLQMPEVVGLGEVGIDHTVSPEFWGSQLRILNSALSFLQDRHVLIIHCRSMARTGDTSEAYMTLLFHLQPRVRKEQIIHLHCFTSSESMVKEWTSVFPNTYFGFSRLVDRFDETQLWGLRAVQDSRILLETDDPYFQFSGGNSK